MGRRHAVSAVAMAVTCSLASGEFSLPALSQSSESTQDSTTQDASQNSGKGPEFRVGVFQSPHIQFELNKNAECIRLCPESALDSCINEPLPESKASYAIEGKSFPYPDAKKDFEEHGCKWLSKEEEDAADAVFKAMKHDYKMGEKTGHGHAFGDNPVKPLQALATMVCKDGDKAAKALLEPDVMMALVEAERKGGDKTRTLAGRLEEHQCHSTADEGMCDHCPDKDACVKVAKKRLRNAESPGMDLAVIIGLESGCIDLNALDSTEGLMDKVDAHVDGPLKAVTELTPSEAYHLSALAHFGQNCKADDAFNGAVDKMHAYVKDSGDYTTIEETFLRETHTEAGCDEFTAIEGHAGNPILRGQALSRLALTCDVYDTMLKGNILDVTKDFSAYGPNDVFEQIWEHGEDGPPGTYHCQHVPNMCERYCLKDNEWLSAEEDVARFQKCETNLNNHLQASQDGETTETVNAARFALEARCLAFQNTNDQLSSLFDWIRVAHHVRPDGIKDEASLSAVSWALVSGIGVATFILM